MRSKKNRPAQKKRNEAPLKEDTNMDDRTGHTALRETELTNYFAQDFTERTERAAQANANVIANQAEILRHVWQTSADIASSVTARSADQLARTLGGGGDEAEKTTGQAARNIAALIQSASVVADAARAISTEVIDLVRHSTERSIDHIGAMTRCLSPEDLVTSQTDAMRDNVELLMDSSRRIAEIALRTAEESSHVVGRNLKPRKPAD
jgi:hypothetical protein